MAAGLTGTELIGVIGAGFGALAVGTAVALPVLGAFHFGLLAGALSGFAAGMVLRVLIVRAKRRRPEGYPLQRALALRHRIAPVGDLVAHHGSWDAMRHDGEGR